MWRCGRVGTVDAGDERDPQMCMHIFPKHSQYITTNHCSLKIIPTKGFVSQLISCASPHCSVEGERWKIMRMSSPHWATGRLPFILHFILFLHLRSTMETPICLATSTENYPFGWWVHLKCSYLLAWISNRINNSDFPWCKGNTENTLCNNITQNI